MKANGTQMLTVNENGETLSRNDRNESGNGNENKNENEMLTIND